jgi:hypothetical protein
VQAQGVPPVLRAVVVVVRDPVERALVAPPEERLRTGPAGVLPLVGARHPQPAGGERGRHVGGRLGETLALHRHEHRRKADVPARAEHAGEVRPKIGAVTEALLQARPVVRNLLSRGLPGVESEPQRHLPARHQGELLSFPLDQDAVHPPAQVLDGLNGGHPPACQISCLVRDVAGGREVERPPLGEGEVGGRHAPQSSTAL